MARSFCGYLSHRQTAHLQDATKHQADHGEGADQHADRYHSAFEVAHTWQRITKGGPPLETMSPPTTKGEAPGGHKRARQMALRRVISGRGLSGVSGLKGLRRLKPDHVPAGFFAGAFCDFAGAGGGVGARSIDTKRPPSKR